MLFYSPSLKLLTSSLLLFFCFSAIAPLGISSKDLDAVAQEENTQKNNNEIFRLEKLSQEQYFQGKYQAVIQTLQKIIPLQKKSAYYMSYKEAEMLNTIGFIYFTKGDRENSITYIKRVLEIGKRLKGQERDVFKDFVLKHITRGGGATPFFDDYSMPSRFNKNEEMKKTIEYMKYMLAVTRKLRYRIEEGFLLNGLGNAYASGFYPERLGSVSTSVSYYKESITVARSLKNKSEAARLMSDCIKAGEGDPYLRIFDSYARVQLLCGQLALKSYREVKNLEKENEMLTEIVEIALALKDYGQANIYLKQRLAQNISQTQKTSGYNSENRTSLLAELGFTSLALGKLDEASQYFQMLLETKSSSSTGWEPSGYQGLGNVYHLRGDYAKAIEYYQSAIKIAPDRRNRRNGFGILATYKDIELDLASVLLENGRFAESESLSNKVLKLALDAPAFVREGIGEPRFIGYPSFAEQARPYNLSSRVLVQQGRISEGLEVSESGRSRATKILITNRLSNRPQNISALLTNDDAITFNTSQIKKVAQEQQSTLVFYSIIYDDKSIIRQNPQVAELYIWVVKPTGEIVFRRTDFKGFQQQNIGLQELVASSRKAVITRNRSSTRTNTRTKNSLLSVGNFVKLKDDLPNWQPWKIIATNPAKKTLTLSHPTFETGVTIERPIADAIAQTTDARNNDPQLQQLYQLLIAPIADQLPTDPNARVVFIPQGELALVPFPALQQPDGKYLIEKHTILTSPSIQVLDLTRQQLDRLQKAGLNNSLVVGVPRNTVVVGNPTMPKVSPELGEAPQTLSALPGAEQEAKAIAQLLKTKALTGKQATKAAVLQQMTQAQIIHLATHGIFDDRNGLNSAVALAPSGKDDGLLTADEILNLKLNAQLVVLSACDTGRGRITGDGVIGLSRSLISAGVPSVIVSLWAIPDAPTAELMTDFYRNLQKGQNKAQALRQAMLNTMKTHPAPRDWAAFTLIGEAE